MMNKPSKQTVIDSLAGFEWGSGFDATRFAPIRGHLLTTLTEGRRPCSHSEGGRGSNARYANGTMTRRWCAACGEVSVWWVEATGQPRFRLMRPWA